jgi:hypothetical protein
MLRGFEVQGPTNLIQVREQLAELGANSALVIDLSGMLGGARQRLALCCFR